MPWNNFAGLMVEIVQQDKVSLEVLVGPRVGALAVRIRTWPGT